MIALRDGYASFEALTGQGVAQTFVNQTAGSIYGQFSALMIPSWLELCPSVQVRLGPPDANVADATPHP